MIYVDFVFHQPTMISDKDGLLREYVNGFFPVSKKLMEQVLEKTTILHVKKGTQLLVPGDVPDKLYLIINGTARTYIQEGDKDITIWIWTELDMVTSIRGFLRGKPTIEYIETLEDCDMASLTYNDLQSLYENHMESNYVARIILEDCYCKSEEVAVLSRLTTAETKYQHFIETKGHLLNRVPLKYIASYLGMTIETLSRIRNKMARNGQNQ